MKHGPILFIDDDKDECELIKDALALKGINNELICFSNARDALGFLKQTTNQPFLIISDINMPGMSGLELRQQIMEDETTKEKAIPFIFLTTSATDLAIKQAYRMSVQGFFEKEHNIHRIADLLQEICSYWQRCRHPNN